MIVASALICGLTPRRTEEYTTIGKVDAPGPETKLAITRSSSDKVKASSQPATSAGAITGMKVREQRVAVTDSHITEYRVRLEGIFVLES